MLWLLLFQLHNLNFFFSHSPSRELQTFVCLLYRNSRVNRISQSVYSALVSCIAKLTEEIGLRFRVLGGAWWVYIVHARDVGGISNNVRLIEVDAMHLG
jgi:hypothetical protein